MFKINEFSLLSKVPMKTLRYYDEIGLMKPTKIDRATGLLNNQGNVLNQRGMDEAKPGTPRNSGFFVFYRSRLARRKNHILRNNV